MALSALLIELLKLKTIKDIFNKFIIGLLLFYSIITFYHTSGWKDSLTLYLRDIPHLENSYNANRIVSAAYVNLGLEYEYTKPAEGEEYFKKAMNMLILRIKYIKMQVLPGLLKGFVNYIGMIIEKH